MNELKINELLPTAFIGFWGGMVLSIFLSRSDEWILFGGLTGAAIHVWQELRDRKRRMKDENTK